MARLMGTQLDLNRCPHCNVDKPTLSCVTNFESADFMNSHNRAWRIYRCSRCGGAVLAAAPKYDQEITEIYPTGVNVDETIPERARKFLEQALNSLSSPAGGVMLAASAVDAMLKAKGYRDGTLYARIDKAAADHIITQDMALWAHDVRLDANEQRHSDETVPLPDSADAKRAVDFAMELAQFMFVLPARVQRGIEEGKKK